MIRLDDLPAEVPSRYRQILLPSLDREDALDVWAGIYARMVYERHARNVRKTLRALHVSYKRLHALIRGA